MTHIPVELIFQHIEYLSFGETLVEEHLNSNNSPYKFNAKEFDSETGNYYYGARYYDPKWSVWLSVDPLYEMFPRVSPYAYVLNNPIRYTDPTGMTAENADDCGIGCTLRKVFNSILYPGGVQNPDGTLSRKKSRATGWDLSQKEKESGRKKEKNSETKGKTTVASVLDRIDIVPQILILQIDVQLSNVIINPRSSFVIDGRTFNIVRGQPQNINFNFSTVGETASRSTDGERTSINRILPLTNSQQQNLEAIANYLIANPQATIRFQYPTPLNSSHPNFNADIREVYQMNFNQVTNYLIKQGVTDPNRRILMNYGKNFDFIVSPGN